MLVREAAALLGAGPRTRSHRVAWGEMVLWEQEMPADELRVVMSSADQELVRRHLDLHVERLGERLIAQQRRVQELGRILAESPDRHDPHPSSSRNPSRP
jgi:hypothetical protein